MTWHYAYTPAIWVPLGTILLLLALATYSWQRRGVPGARSFTFALLFAALWAVGSLLEYAAVDLPTKIGWVKFQAVWQLPAAIAITCFLLEYAWPGRWLTRRNLVLLYIVPILMTLAILTDHLHHQIWSGFAFTNHVTPLVGPLGWIGVAYGYSFLLVNFIVYAWLFLHSPQHRWFVVLMLIGQMGMRLTYLLERAQAVRIDLPLEMFGIVFAYIMYTIALFRYQVLNPVPLANQAVIDQLHEGMVVLNLESRVSRLNPAAVAILGLPNKQAFGRPVSDLIPSYSCPLVGENGESEISLKNGENIRNYLVTTSTLKDWRGQAAGRLLLLHDVTEQKRAQAQLLEQQRALAMLSERELLARELHDGIGQVLGYIKMTSQAARDQLAQDQRQNVDRQLAQMIAVAQEAHSEVREYLLGAKTSPVGKPGFLTSLNHFLQNFNKHYPLQAELVAPPDWHDEDLEATVATQLLRIIQEALSNARKHALAECVQVSLDVKDGFARVEVRDDGVGFDPTQLATTAGQKYGLGYIRERAAEVGGCAAIYSTPGQGTRVIVEVPVKKEAGTR